MNLSYFISKRFRSGQKGSFSNTVSSIAIGSIAFSLVVLLGAFLILGAFKNTIKEKVFSFDSHVQLFKLNNSFDNKDVSSLPVSTNYIVFQHPDTIPEISHIQAYANKAGMMLHNEEVHASMLKGVGPDFRKEEFTKSYLLKGQFPRFDTARFSTNVIISKKIATKSRLEVGDSFIMSFLRFGADSARPRHTQRRLEVSGIYETNLPEIDDKMIIADIRLVQQILKWEPTQVGGFEIFVNKFTDIEKVAEEAQIMSSWPGQNPMYVQTIEDNYEEIFRWLDLLNTNLKVLIVIVFGIACFNMFSTLYILVMERTHAIGVLKALGAANLDIARIFWLNGLNLLLKGMFWGNLIGLGICALQYFFKIIPLDPENYYMSHVPIEWNWPIILMLNLFIFLFVNAVLFVPVVMISSLQPIKSIRFS